jgi:hypothetical protein
MSRYLLIWDLSPAYVSENAVERGNQWKQLMKMVQQDMQKGVTKDWGAFIAERSGYCVVEGTELEVSIMAQQYAPYVEFSTHPCSSFDQTNELLDALTSQ